MIEPNEQPRGSEQSYPFGADSSGSNTSTSSEETTPEELGRVLLAKARAAVTHANNSDLGKRKAAMVRSNQAVLGLHADGSKYKHKNYSARSKLFIPKTRSAVKAKMVAARAALFGTEQAVDIEAEDDTDPRQQASAELNMALLNYRLDRSTGRKAGVPWFQIAMGAAYHACVSGICVTKQYWAYKEKLEEVEEGYDPNDPKNAEQSGSLSQRSTVDQGLVGMNGRPVRRTVVWDKPVIEPHAPENIIVDMAAPWWNVVQEGAFFIVKHPMHVADVKAMMKPGAQHLGGGAWIEIPEKVMASSIADMSATGVRSSRTGGQDRYSRSAQPPVNDFDIVWVHENFIRHDDCDYHFWSLGTKQLLSKPGKVGTVGHYPAHRGERPYVMGVGSIEPDVAIPMSHVESWRPLQDEINDGRNLRLDTMKQAISPIMLYRQGANVDLRATRELGPDARIGVSDLAKDIKFERITGPDASSYAEMDRLNSEFDELAGSFATSTVQTSRAIGETARGMQLVNSSANSVQEFDLAVFLETWAEPTIRQFVWLEQYYETDQTLLALLARKAHLYERFGEDIVLDDLLERQLTIKVNIGPGAGDPVQKLQRLNAAIDMSLKVGEAVQGQVMPQAEEIFSQIWAPTGISAQRAFKFTSPEEAEQKAAAQAAAQPNPDVMRVQIDQQKLELESQKSMLDLQISREKNDLERQKLQLERDRLVAEIARVNGEMAMKADSQRQDFALREQSQNKDFNLRAAGHNKHMVDEATGEATDMLTPHEARQPLPVETMLTDTMGQLMQVMQQLAQSQQQQTDQIGMILAQGQQTAMMLQQSNAQTQELLTQLITHQRAPRRVIRDEKGSPVGVEIGGEERPITRDPTGAVTGV